MMIFQSFGPQAFTIKNLNYSHNASKNSNYLESKKERMGKYRFAGSTEGFEEDSKSSYRWSRHLSPKIFNLFIAVRIHSIDSIYLNRIQGKAII